MDGIRQIFGRVVNHPTVKGWLAGRGLPNRVHVVVGLWIPIVILFANMWRGHRFTYDDAYISFRYAANLVAGHGLVYNPGEFIEGYTNFLWTLLIAAGMQIGVGPHITSKVVGAACSIATLVVVYRLSNPPVRVPEFSLRSDVVTRQ